jgi:hypothetical protein
MQPADAAKIDMQEASSCVEEWNREMMSVSFNRRAEVESLDLNFHETAQCILPIRTFIYLPPIFLSYISRQNRMNPVSSDEASDDDEGPPDLIGDSDDDDSDSSLSCNSTLASMESSNGSMGNISDDDDVANF